jgi:cytochrome c553
MHLEDALRESAHPRIGNGLQLRGRGVILHSSMGRRAGGILAALLLSASAAAAQDGGGKQVYARKCASCHGPAGEGTKEHPDPLAGTKPLDRLTEYVAKKMPEDKPGTLTADEARVVSAWIHDAFYSPVAQERIRPARIELARLTVRQYQNTVADLLAGFGPAVQPEAKRGLRAEFFNGGRRFREGSRIVDRVDETVKFDFGAAAPAPGVSDKEYSIRWSGGVFAPETGDYEFIIETSNGARLWVNDAETPLVDVWVRSGTQKEHKESVFLLGGRTYGIKLEMFRAKEEKAAAVALKWRRPDREPELLPPSRTTPGRFPELLALRTTFPPDDRSRGFERGNLVSKAWDEAATSAALDVAAHVVAHLPILAGTRTDAKDAKGVLIAWSRRFVERAFRRPLAEADVPAYVDRHFAETPDLELAVKKVVLLALKSPRFLYRETGQDAYDTASRISYGLWDSMPDAALLEAAKAGRLATPEGVSAEIARMMPDPRTREKVRGFFRLWLQIDRLHELAKDPKRYPDFTDQVESDLRDSLDLLVEDATWADEAGFRTLLLCDAVWLNGRLAKFYGAELPADAPFQKVTLQKQSGILTHPLLMAGFAYDATTSPIHRGVFIARSLLGKRLRPPPDAVTPTPPELKPELSTRERIAEQTRPANCQSCHEMINPLGFTLEHFDAVGRLRGEEKGRPVDASGSYLTASGETVRFQGARDLGEFLAKSPEAQAAFVEQVYHYMVKQPILAYGPDKPEALRKGFAAGGFNVRKLLAEMVSTAAQSGGKGKGK